MKNFEFYEAFMLQAAEAIGESCPGVEFGPAYLYPGSTEKQVYLFFTTPGRVGLCELVTRRQYGKHGLPIARITGNRRLKRCSLATVRRLGIPEQRQGRGCFHTGYCRMAAPQFELTCYETELPELAALAVAWATGQSGRDLAALPGAHLVGADVLATSGHDYAWTYASWAAVEEWHRGFAIPTPPPKPIVPGPKEAEPIPVDPEPKKASPGRGYRPPWSTADFNYRPSWSRGGVDLSEPAATGPKWTHEAEAALNRKRFFSAEQHAGTHVGESATADDLAEIEETAQAYCMIHLLPHRTLLKQGRAVNYWPLTALTFGNSDSIA